MPTRFDTRPPFLGQAVVWATPWLARGLLLGFGVWGVRSGARPLVAGDLQALAFFFGLTALGLVVATFGRTARAGLVVAAVGLWAAGTWYGVTALVAPGTAIRDSAGGRSRVDTPLGAYVSGVLVLVVANAPWAVWLWWRRSDRRREAEATPERAAE